MCEQFTRVAAEMDEYAAQRARQEVHEQPAGVDDITPRFADAPGHGNAGRRRRPEAAQHVGEQVDG